MEKSHHAVSPREKWGGRLRFNFLVSLELLVLEEIVCETCQTSRGLAILYFMSICIVFPHPKNGLTWFSFGA